MVRWTGVVLHLLYPQGYPPHLFWVLDGTYLEKRYAQTIDEVMPYLRRKITEQQRRALLDKWMKGLKEGAEIEIMDLDT